jgi:hypothetical protein
MKLGVRVMNRSAKTAETAGEEIINMVRDYGIHTTIGPELNKSLAEAVRLEVTQSTGMAEGEFF